MDDPRATLDELIRQRGVNYSSISRLLGRNVSYIQQFIRKGSGAGSAGSRTRPSTRSWLA